MAPNHVTEVAARAETKDAVTGLVTGLGNTVETGRTANRQDEAQVEKNSEGVRAETVKEVEAEIGVYRMGDIAAARVKRVVGEGHDQGRVVRLGRGRRLASAEASEVG